MAQAQCGQVIDGEHLERCSGDDDNIGMLDGAPRQPVQSTRQHLVEQYHIGFERMTAGATRRFPTTDPGQQRLGRNLSLTLQACGGAQMPVQFIDLARPGALMQPVEVLRNDGSERPVLFKRRQGVMRRIGCSRQHTIEQRSEPVVKCTRIAQKVVQRRNFRWIDMLPGAVGTAKIGDARGSADARAGDGNGAMRTTEEIGGVPDRCLIHTCFHHTLHTIDVDTPAISGSMIRRWLVVWRYARRGRIEMNNGSITMIPHIRNMWYAFR
jgi:hypothetical protein